MGLLAGIRKAVAPTRALLGPADEKVYLRLRALPRSLAEASSPLPSDRARTKVWRLVDGGSASRRFRPWASASEALAPLRQRCAWASRYWL